MVWLPGDEIHEVEQQLEDKAIADAKRAGWWTRKYSSMQRKSAPDRLFAKDGFIFWVEFKRQLKEPTKSQWSEIREMQDAGLTVYWCDCIEDYRALLRHHGGRP